MTETMNHERHLLALALYRSPFIDIFAQALVGSEDVSQRNTGEPVYERDRFIAS